MKRSQPKRDWSLTHSKVEEGCRICGAPAERAHVIGRVHDREPALREPWITDRGGLWIVHPDRIVPLCGPTPGGHHGQYDRYELDLLPHLTLHEQLQAVADAGGIESARRRLIGTESYEEAA